jgi:hypothetical protein
LVSPIKGRTFPVDILERGTDSKVEDEKGQSLLILLRQWNQPIEMEWDFMPCETNPTQHSLGSRAMWTPIVHDSSEM